MVRGWRIFTGSIARSAKRRYLSYSETDFEVFRPAGAKRCTDGMTFGTEEWIFDKGIGPQN